MAGGRSTWTTRKPAKVLTLAEKIAVIKGYETVRNCTKLAIRFNCSDKQIRNILHKKNVFLAEWKDKTADPIWSKLSVKRMVHGAVVHEWVQRCRSHGLTVYDKQILSTGQEFAILINMKEFQPTLLWLKQLKSKFKMTNLEPIPNETKPKKSLKLLDILQELTKKGLPKRFQPYILDEIDKKTSRNVQRKGVSQSNAPENQDAVSTTGKGNMNDGLKSGELLNKADEDGDDKKLKRDKNLRTRHKENTLLETNELAKGIAKKRKNSKSLSSYSEALYHLATLERFALIRQDDKALGFINQLESLFNEQSP